MSVRENSTVVNRSNSTLNCDISNCDSIDNKFDKCNFEHVEEGMDLLNTIKARTTENVDINLRSRSNQVNRVARQENRISRSVGSYTDEDKQELGDSIYSGSDPLLNKADINNINSTPQNHQPTIDIIPKEAQDTKEVIELSMGKVENSNEQIKNCGEIVIVDTHTNPLTSRTDALLNTTSFKLVRPKY